MSTPTARETAEAPAADPMDRFTAQTCPAGKHADWAVDSEDAHTCPWCEIDRLKFLFRSARDRADNLAGRVAELTADVALMREGRAAIRSAAFTEAATVAGCFDDLTPEEERPGYDGPTIDPEDRLREAIDPRVDLGRRERVIAEHRQMVVGEIVAKLQSLGGAPAEES